jgi:hypothetical protein
MTRRAPARRFTESDVVPTQSIEEAERQMLSDLVFDAIADRQVVTQLASVLGPGVLARLQAGRKSVARGDFGEVLASASIQEFDDLVVPVGKLRFEIDPEQTQPGTDVVGFRLVDGEIVSLEFIETKLRTTRSLGTAVEAHAQLAEDDESEFAGLLEFLAERLAERGDALYESLLRYLEQREPDNTDARTYGIFLVWDLSAWDEEVLARLNDVVTLLQPLHVRIALLPEVANLVTDVYARIGIEAVDDGT